MAKTREQRFWGKVDRGEHCWAWTGAKYASGAGAFWNGTRVITAHLFSAQMHGIEIPGGHFVGQGCGDISCVNPAHLRVCTRSDLSKMWAPPPDGPSDVEFFESRVRKGDGCWEWQGSIKDNGYGRMDRGRGQVLAHRFAFEVFVGAIPPEMFVCHHCDNPSCVRPDHLFLGTSLDNARDAAAKRRMRGGPRHTGAMLSWDDVDMIRRIEPSGHREVDALAEELGVSRGAVYRVLGRRTYRDRHRRAPKAKGVIFDT